MCDLTFSDPLGINISPPPEAIHVILLAHRTRLLNAFVRVENVKLKKQKNKKMRQMVHQRKRKM